MSFVKEYTNYATNTMPFTSINQVPISTAKANFTYEGVQYSFQRQIVNTSNISKLNGVIFELINLNNPLLIIKSKNENRYLIFNCEQSGNTYYIYAYANNTPSLENAIRIGQTSDIIRNYTTTEYNHFIALTNNFLGFGISGGNYQILLCNGYTIESINTFMGEIESINFSEQYGNASASSGYGGGSFDDSSDTVGIPTTPTIGVTNVGFVNVYKTSLNSLQNLGSELFPDFTPPQPAPLGSDVAEMLQLGFNNLVENIVNFSNMYINSNLINYVIDCHCLPISPSVGDSENIKIGFKEFTQSANKVTSDYVDFDCGTLNIGEYYTNFIDYVGTRAKLYLPFIGFVDIQPEYFQSGTLQVIYRFNIIDGSFMAYVISSSSKSQLRNSVIASYGGNACVHIPITGINYSNMISSVLNGATSIVSGHSKGQVAVNTALDTLASKPPMQSSNGYNATSAYLGIRYPYLIIEREVSNFSEKYTNEYGLPCNITKNINELSGFIQMDNIHLETLTCTDDEKTLIQNLLQNGIIV